MGGEEMKTMINQENLVLIMCFISIVGSVALMMWIVSSYNNRPKMISRHVESHEKEMHDFNIDMQKIEDQRIDRYVEREAHRLVRYIENNRLISEALKNEDYLEYQKLSLLLIDQGIYIPSSGVSAYHVYHAYTAKYSSVKIRECINKRADEILKAMQSHSFAIIYSSQINK